MTKILDAIKSLSIARFRRILMGLMSQGYAQLVTIATQLLTVPFLLSSWGAEKYGAWILLSTIPAYISMADLGFLQIAANDMTMRVSRDDKDGANVVFQTATAMVACIVGVIVVLFGGIAFLLPITETFHIKSVSPSEASWTVFILAIQVLLAIVYGLFGAGLRSVGLWALMVSVNSTARLLDGIALVTVAIFHGSFVTVALITITSRALITTATALRLFRREPWLKLGIGLASPAKVREMLIPSLSYMSYTLSFALSIQGITLVTGAVLGPAATAVVSTVRTLTRMGAMASNMFNHTLEPEYAQLYGQGRRNAMKDLYRRQILIVGSIAGVYTLATLAAGEWILDHWTHGRIHPSFVLLFLMTVSVTFEMLWSLLQTPFVSTNRHKFFALWYVGFSALAVAITWALISRAGLSGVGWGTAISNFAFLLLTLYKVKRADLLPADLDQQAPTVPGSVPALEAEDIAS